MFGKEDIDQLYKLSFEYAPIGIALVGLDGKWIVVNEALCKLTGYPKEELLNLTFQDITHPDDLDTDLRFVNDLLNGNIDSYFLEKRYITKDKKTIWIKLHGSIVRKDQKPLFFIAQIQDINSQKAETEKVTTLNAQLTELNNMMLDREVKMVELKEELKKLKQR